MAEASGIVPVHTQIDNLLTHDECMSLRGFFLDHVEKKGWMPARIYKGDQKAGSAELDPEQRKGKVYFDKGRIPFTSKLITAMEQYAARKNIQLDVDRVDWQFSKYEIGDKFIEHKDSHLNPSHFHPGIRKISLTVQLSEPGDYEGGVLRVQTSHNTYAHVNTNIGTTAIFPSWLNHSVTEVTSGTRYALVGWYKGPFWI